MRIGSYSLWAVLAMFAAGLYFMKYDVQALKDSNERLKASIENERLALEMLEAEWVYLNRPDRLQVLASRYLKHVPAAPREMVTWDAIPRARQQVAKLGE